jgi:hypothetical protein
VLDDVDRMVRALDSAARDTLVTACVEEIASIETAKAARLADYGTPQDSQPMLALEKVLRRFGYAIGGGSVFPLSLELDMELGSLPTEVSAAIAEALRRYRDGKYAGAITSICGAVDKITELIYEQKSLGDHKAAKYQERVSKSFVALDGAYCAPLNAKVVSPNEVALVWQNHKQAVSQAAYVLAAFRRIYSDVHGEQDAPPEFVQRSLDCAVFILRSFCGVAPES